VVPVPGPSAALTGLLGSGLSTEQFYFAGFLPAKAQQRRDTLAQLCGTITVCRPSRLLCIVIAGFHCDRSLEPHEPCLHAAFAQKTLVELILLMHQ
jgi:16S rRNA (cytidine1402-2'-O)-methyltransferase